MEAWIFKGIKTKQKLIYIKCISTTIAISFIFAQNNDIFFLYSQPYLYNVIGKIIYLGDNVLILVYVAALDENLSTSSQFCKVNIGVEELYDNFYLTYWF